MKTVLVLPPYGLFESYGVQGGVKRGALPPLGVGYLAACAQEAGHEVVFLDAPVIGLNIEQTATAVLAEEPHVVGISCVTKAAESAYALAHALKEKNGEVLIVMGGPHATSFPDGILDACPDIDILVPGEGELIYAELLDRLAANASIEGLEGVVFRKPGDGIVAAPPRPLLKDLDALPHPARNIYRNELYIPLPNQCRRRPATTAITSRGCPYGRCKFCYQGGRYASRYRRRSPGHVVEEIEQLVRDYGVREIIFWDDNFCINEKWIDAFCDLLDSRRVDVTWTVQGRVNTVTEHMLKRMAASGCYNVYYGFESGNQTMLDAINKGITLDQSRNAVKWAKKAGMEIRGSFMFGLPGETPEIAEETIRFACELNADWMIFYPYHVQPGTPLADIAMERGVNLPEAADMHAPSYVPEGYENADQLARTIRSAYRRYYLRPRYVMRALLRARNPAVLKNYWAAFRYWLKFAHG